MKNKKEKIMAIFREICIVEKITIGDKIWEIISYLEDNLKKFDVVCYSKFDTDKIAKELISSKERVKTFEDIKEAKKFLERLT